MEKEVPPHAAACHCKQPGQHSPRAPPLSCRLPLYRQCKVQELKGMACAALGGLDAEDYEVRRWRVVAGAGCLPGAGW